MMGNLIFSHMLKNKIYAFADNKRNNFIDNKNTFFF